ncbi:MULTISPECIES: hypothetical protein [Streptomyces]|uniref:hypothetical protein n=1 Tax=Streptomyces TaxID=1883 RepID=UPI00345BDD94
MSTERIAEFNRICDEQREHLNRCTECDVAVGRLCKVVHGQIDDLAKLIRSFTDEEYREVFGKERRQ